MERISFWKIVNLLVFMGLVVLSILNPTVTPVLIAYGVIWGLFQTKLSEVEVQGNDNDNALRTAKILQSTNTILGNLNDMVGMVGDRIMLEDSFDELDIECAGCDNHNDKPREVYKPKEGKRYWVVSFGMPDNIDEYVWDNDEMDQLYYEMGNCFRTKKGAKDYAKKCVEILKSEL